jgi:hypothetical protein
VTLSGSALSTINQASANLTVATPTVALGIPAQGINVSQLATQLGTTNPQSVNLSVQIQQATQAALQQAFQNIASTPLSTLNPTAMFSVNLTAQAGTSSIPVSSFGGGMGRLEINMGGLGGGPTVQPVSQQALLNSNVMYMAPGGSMQYMGTRPNLGTRTLSVFLPHASDYSVVEFYKTFDDIKTHWAKSDIELMAGKYIVMGTTDKTFTPERSVTRAEFAVMLGRAALLQEYTGTDAQFSDVPTTAWYYGMVEAAARAGLVKGTGDGKFSPNALVTREQVGVMVARALKMEGKAKDLSAAEVTAALAAFTDKNTVSDWAGAELALAVQNGIVKGSNNAITAKGNATRAMAASMISRYWMKVVE